jgi:hypothetical protein
MTLMIVMSHFWQKLISSKLVVPLDPCILMCNSNCCSLTCNLCMIIVNQCDCHWLLTDSYRVATGPGKPEKSGKCQGKNYVREF